MCTGEAEAKKRRQGPGSGQGWLALCRSPKKAKSSSDWPQRLSSLNRIGRRTGLKPTDAPPNAVAGAVAARTLVVFAPFSSGRLGPCPVRQQDYISTAAPPNSALLIFWPPCRCFTPPHPGISSSPLHHNSSETAFFCLLVALRIALSRLVAFRAPFGSFS